MGLMDLLKASENNKLKKELEEAKTLMSPEQLKAKDILDYISELEDKKGEIEKVIDKLNKEVANLHSQVENKKKEIVILDEEILMQDFGLYRPLYDFATSSEYKDALDSIRAIQKEMIKNKSAVNYFDQWTVDGSKAKGRKMTNDNIKQIIKTFNVECESIIDKVKFNNIDSMKKRIEKAFDTLNKMNETNRVNLTQPFLESKLQELNLAYEYKRKKQEEKEEQKRLREELREQEKAQKELEEARKNITKDIAHYTNALNKVLNQLLSDDLSEEMRELLNAKKEELEKQLADLNKNLEDIDYRQTNQKAGFVYVISNIGAFGDNVYKIGMTRRLEPQDRVDELGDASVPFTFDVHAMIFSDDAPALENALHKAFDDRKINMINNRKEFFRVTLDEIEQVVKANYDKTVDFVKTPDAEQYRESKKIIESFSKSSNSSM